MSVSLEDKFLPAAYLLLTFSPFFEIENGIIYGCITYHGETDGVCINSMAQINFKQPTFIRNRAYIFANYAHINILNGMQRYTIAHNTFDKLRLC